VAVAAPSEEEATRAAREEATRAAKAEAALLAELDQEEAQQKAVLQKKVG